MGCKGSKDQAESGDAFRYDKVSDVYEACLFGNLEILSKKLTTSNVNTPKSANGPVGGQVYPLHIGMQSSKADVVKFILEKGAKMDQEQGTERENVLHVGASHNNIIGIREVFDFAKAKNSMNVVTKMVNQPSGSNSLTPLMIAVVNGNYDIVDLFLSVDADLSLRDDLGKNSLELCRFWRNTYDIRKVEGYTVKRVPEYEQIEALLVSKTVTEKKETSKNISPESITSETSSSSSPASVVRSRSLSGSATSSTTSSSASTLSSSESSDTSTVSSSS